MPLVRWTCVHFRERRHFCDRIPSLHHLGGECSFLYKVYIVYENTSMKWKNNKFDFLMNKNYYDMTDCKHVPLERIPVTFWEKYTKRLRNIIHSSILQIELLWKDQIIFKDFYAEKYWRYEKRLGCTLKIFKEWIFSIFFLFYTQK